jgi:hypothetical protein
MTDQEIADALTYARLLDEHPDEQTIHHAMYMLRKRSGLPPPSFDEFRIRLREYRKLSNYH